jgi:hypothetical protein
MVKGLSLSKRKRMVRFLLSLVIAAMLLFTACTNKTAASRDAATAVDTIPTLVMQIQRCSRLYAAQCNLRKIITHSDKLSINGQFMKHDYNIDLPLGERKIAIPVDAEVKAYIDFDRFSAQNVIRHGNKIEIVLPDPRLVLTSTCIDHDAVKQYVPLARSRFTDDELTAYERQGRQAIINDIAKLDITEQARESAARILIPMIVAMGFNEADVTVSFRKDFDKNDVRAMLDNSNLEHHETEK